MVEDGSPSMAIKCHKMVLAACSTMFQELLLKAPTTDQYVTLLLPDIKAWEMEAILAYMYQGEVCISQDKIPDLVKVASMLKVKGLIHEDDPEETSSSPPPTISSTGHDAHDSPPHPSSSHQDYEASTSGNAEDHSEMDWKHLTPETVLNPVKSRKSKAILPAYKKNENGQNGNPTILRTVLAQGYADSSQPSTSGVNDGLYLPSTLNGHSAFTADSSTKTVTRRSQTSQKPKTTRSSSKFKS